MDRLKSPEAIANHQARQKRNREACNKTDKRKVKKSKNKAARLGTEQEVLTPEEFEAHVAADTDSYLLGYREGLAAGHPAIS